MMFALWVGWAVADPTYDRLFGADPTAVEAPAPEPGPAIPSWALPAGLLALGLAGAWRLKRDLNPAAAPSPLRVIARQPAGDRSSLLLVEVPGADGQARRLLVGTGSGAPTLVADLGLLSSAPAPVARAPVDDAEPDPLPAPTHAFARTLADEVLAERARPRFFSEEDLAPPPPDLKTPLLSTAPPRIALPPRLASEPAARPERRFLRARNLGRPR